MTRTLLITLLLESLVVFVYCRWHRKPLQPLLVTSVCANLVTQLFLWVVLTLFFHSYVMAIIIAEGLIWGVEMLVLYAVPTNQLTIGEAASLSTIMNFLSFGVGWVLPL